MRERLNYLGFFPELIMNIDNRTLELQFEVRLVPLKKGGANNRSRV